MERLGRHVKSAVETRDGLGVCISWERADLRLAPRADERPSWTAAGQPSLAVISLGAQHQPPPTRSTTPSSSSAATLPTASAPSLADPSAVPRSPPSQAPPPSSAAACSTAVAKTAAVAPSPAAASPSLLPAAPLQREPASDAHADEVKVERADAEPGRSAAEGPMTAAAAKRARTGEATAGRAGPQRVEPSVRPFARCSVALGALTLTLRAPLPTRREARRGAPIGARTLVRPGRRQALARPSLALVRPAASPVQPPTGVASWIKAPFPPACNSTTDARLKRTAREAFLVAPDADAR